LFGRLPRIRFAGARVALRHDPFDEAMVILACQPIPLERATRFFLGRT
jgi:hypothetical protein